jgi:alpha/beta superfamily hydrolase
MRRIAGAAILVGMLRHAFVLAVLAAASFIAHAQDYEREKRWADEVAPGVIVGDVEWIEAGSGRKFLALYAPAPKPKAALVIVHGVGVHPDHGVIGVLRSKLHDLGYTTLSIQMPVLASDAKAEDYAKVFPDALDRIGKATAWLQSRGATRLVLVTHSLGAWMGDEYLAANPSAPFVAWVAMGRSGPFGKGAASKRPVLDVYGESDLPAVLAAVGQRGKVATRQVRIDGADHFYARREDALAVAIDGWLESLR